MGILKPGIQCVLMKGRNFGQKITIDKVDEKFVYFKIKDKENKIGIRQVFPLK
jgi:ribosomal protein L14E/L6E/L27E